LEEGALNQSAKELTAESAELLDLGVVLGQNNTFALLAGRCSAAQAAAMRRVREERIYKCCSGSWEAFCGAYLKISRSEADKLIRLLEEFGPRYFEVAQLTRISPEAYRAIAPAVEDGALHHNGEAIELNPENAGKVAAAVAELRRAANLRKPPLEIHLRIERLQKRCSLLILEFEDIVRKERCTGHWPAFMAVFQHVESELGRLREDYDIE